MFGVKNAHRFGHGALPNMSHAVPEVGSNPVMTSSLRRFWEFMSIDRGIFVEPLQGL